MKRPLFWAVTAFALGEVEGLYFDRILQISIALAVLICAAVHVVRQKRYAVYETVCALCMIFGLVNVVTRRPVDVMKALGTAEEAQQEYAPVRVEGYVYGLQPAEEGCNMLLCTERDGCKIRLIVYGVSENVQIGSYISVSGTLCRPMPAENPGGFDAQAYLWSRGIDGILYQPVCRVTDSSVAGSLPALLRGYYKWKDIVYRLRCRLTEKLYLITDSSTAGMYAGILLGDKNGIPAGLLRLYQMAGISHILAISGLHVTLLGMGVFRLLRRTGMRLSWTTALSFIWILFYGMLTGWSFATIRAVVMLCIVIGGECLGRGADLLTGTAATLGIMLLAEPYRLLDGGMVLSFTAIYGVAFGRYVLQRLRLMQRVKRLRHKRLCYMLLSSVMMSLCLQLVMVPVIARLYYVIPAYSVLVNLLVVPLLTPVLLSGAAGLLIGCINAGCGYVLCVPGKYILRFYTWLCECTVRLPGSSIGTGKPKLWLIALYYLLLVFFVYFSTEAPQRKLRELLYRKRHVWYGRKSWCRVMLIVYCCMIGLAGAGLYGLHQYTLCEQVTFLDVGQGDGILIRTEAGTNLVIDGGSVSRDSLGEYVLLPALRSLAMTRVDYWFVSHTDADHISGLLEILALGEVSGVHIENLVVSAYAAQDEEMSELVHLASVQGISVYYMDVGEYVTDGESFLMRCLHPDGAFVAEDKNEASLALEYQSDYFRMLFTGDMGADALRYMLTEEMSGAGRRYDVVKAPHHGSKYSCMEELYDMTDAVVISCGQNNRYGHPHEEVIRLLEEKNIRIYRTDYDGAVIFRH